MSKKNLILADCDKEEIKSFAEGLQSATGEKFEIENKECNGSHNLINNIKRYVIYFIYPFQFFIKRGKYNYIIGWQQFFTLFFAFYCNLFHVKKENIVIVCNFTYKEKKGIVGKLYRKIMLFCVKNDYIDYIHVPSKKYAEECSNKFDITINKFIVTNFGLPDTYEKWKDSNVEYNNYSLAIGRSNRDYDFLINAWKKVSNNQKLLIICDQYKPSKKLPNNIIIRNDITGDKQFPYIINCKLMIIPLKDSNICSGDTVLLKAMSYSKPVVITKPSTLAEMYIENGKNGICLEKNVEEFSNNILNLLLDSRKMESIGKNARKKYLEKYSRQAMGNNIGREIKNNIIGRK